MAVDTIRRQWTLPDSTTRADQPHHSTQTIAPSSHRAPNTAAATEARSRSGHATADDIDEAMFRRLRKRFARRLSTRKRSNGHELSEAEPKRSVDAPERSEADSERTEAEPERSDAESEHHEAEPERPEAQSGRRKTLPKHSEAKTNRYEAERERLPDTPHCEDVITPQELCLKATTTSAQKTPNAAANSVQAEFARQTPDPVTFEALPPPSVHYNYESQTSRRSAPTSTPSVRITEQCQLHPHTDNAVSALVDRCVPDEKTYMTLKASTFHLATVGRTLVTPGPSRHTVVRLLNLSNRPVNIHAGTIIAVLVPAERATRSTEYNKSDEGVWPKVNFDSIPDVERGLLGCLLTQKRHLFANETGRIPFEDREPPAINSETLDPVEQEPTNDLLTYLAECRPARNTFPFPTEPCAVRCVNDASWQLAMSYADRHIPRRFHATVHLPTELHLPPNAPKARYITTLTPLHHNASDALPFHELRRLVELCTSALNQPTLPPGYAQAETDLETHILCVMAAYAPVILFAAQDATDARLNQFLELIDKSGVRLDADRSFIAEPTATLCGVTFEPRRCYAAIRSRSLNAAPYAATFDNVRTLWTPLPNCKCFVHINTDEADKPYAVAYQEQQHKKPVAVLTSTIPSGREQPWHHTAATAMRLLAPSFPANAAVTLCCPERHAQLQRPLNRILHELKSTITPCIHRYL
ncbi:hypothetical protein AAVH_38676 [Aphelenchoides avenae]|nr:hypothetical protein AAVH_38676 [Aphelenchus avenae]